MTKEREALKLALEALKECRDRFFPLDQHETARDLLWVPVNSAVTKCEEALAQPVQLVTWTGNGSAERRNIEAPRGYFFQVDRKAMIEENDDIQDYKWPWVGLTDEERDAIEAATLDLHGIPKFFATAIEAKLKDKNTTPYVLGGAKP